MSTFVDQEVKFFSSGSTLLDLALGGGWALPRVFNIVGDKSTGKTLLAIEAFANFQRVFPKGRMRYAESESAFDEVYAEVLGFPEEVERPDDLLNTVEEFTSDFYKFISKGGPGLYIVDSLDALSDDAEIKKFLLSQKRKEKEEEGEEVAPEKGSYGAEKAKKMSKLFRMLNGDAAKANCSLGVVSQVRDNIGVMWGEKQTRSGGKALDFYASQVLWLREIKKIERTALNDTRAVGVSIQGKVKKCKVGFPFREVDFDIIFSYGVDDESSMLSWLKSIKQMDESTAKQLKTQLTKAREKRDYQVIKQISDQLKVDATKIWKQIEEELAPPMRKYDIFQQNGEQKVIAETGIFDPSKGELVVETKGSLPVRNMDWRERIAKKQEEENGTK